MSQDEARIEVIDALDENSVLLVQDWAMKFLPRKFREAKVIGLLSRVCLGTLL